MDEAGAIDLFSTKKTIERITYSDQSLKRHLNASP